MRMDMALGIRPFRCLRRRRVPDFFLRVQSDRDLRTSESTLYIAVEYIVAASYSRYSMDSYSMDL
jgi:hypothetical protein